ncbi:MAG: tRNA lysidine(34) synthetase TilS [Clostridia bacterium]
MLSCAIWDYLAQFDRLALAVSGGKDSMTLLDIFTQKKEWTGKFFVVNVQHNLRGQASVDDSAFVKAYCEKNGIEFQQFDIDVIALCQEKHYTIEQGARIIRREIFATIVADGKASRVLTAHHKDDQIESIFMHILRGCGLNGLIGMRLDDGVLVRPMLEISREKINDYAQANNLAWRQDESNFDNNYTRNKLRNEIIPLLESVYPSCGDNVVRLGKIAEKAVEFVSASLPECELKNGEISIPVDLFDKRYLAEQAIVGAVDKLATRVDLTFRQLEAVFELAKKTSGSRVDLPWGLSAYKQSNAVVIRLRESKNEFSYPFDKGEFDCGEWQIEISERDNGGLRADSDKLSGGVIRNRDKGDKIEKFGGMTKSLGDYLTDKKVAKRMRDNLPIIARGNEAFVVCGVDISEKAKIDENTQRICYIKATQREK